MMQSSSSVESVVTRSGQSRENEKHQHSLRASRRVITVEPVLIFINLVQGALVTLRSQYIEHRLADRLNYTLPMGQNRCDVHQDSTDKSIESQTSTWVTLMRDVSVFPPVLVALTLGVASDFVGRRPMFIYNAVGHLCGSVLFLLIALFKLPLWVLIVGEAMLGLSGDTVFAVIIAQAYVADIYSGRALTFRLVVVDALANISFGVIQYGMGEILQGTGYNFVVVYSIIAGIALVNLFYTVVPLFVIETVERRPFSRGVVTDLARSIPSLFSGSRAGRMWRLGLLLAIVGLWTLIFDSAAGNVTIYGLSPPFCWRPATVGAYGALYNVIPALVSIIAVPVLSLCMTTYWMVYIGFISGIGFFITTALAPTTLWLAYIAPLVGMFYLMPLPIVKAKLSEQVDAKQQGTVFGCLAVVVSLAKFISPILLMGVLELEVHKKVNSQPTVTYYVAAGILILPMIINGVLHVFHNEATKYAQLDGTGDGTSPDSNWDEGCVIDYHYG